MRETKREPLGEAIVILLYFALKPLYFGASGFLQISDMVLLASLAFLIFRVKGHIAFDRESSPVIKLYLFMLVYQCLINGIWTIVTGDKSLNRHDLYYIFNFLAFAECLFIGQRVGIDAIKRAMGVGSFAAVLITAIGLIIYSGPASRSTGFFNNPNQLGYFAVIMLTVIALCKDRLSKVQIVTIFVISAWSVVVSLSKAAILAYFVEVIVLILFYQENRSVKRLILEFVLLAAAGAAIYLLFFSNINFGSSNKTILQMRNRILYMSEENDSELAYGRGYARVLEVIPNIVWGEGEGAYDRFIVKHGTEVHSTFASLLTCYGLIGLFGYIVIFKKCMGKGKQFIQSLVVLSGLFLYAITHNGIRNTLLWMIMALLLMNCSKQDSLLFSDRAVYHKM